MSRKKKDKPGEDNSMVKCLIPDEVLKEMINQALDERKPDAKIVVSEIINLLMPKINEIIAVQNKHHMKLMIEAIQTKFKL